MGILPTVHRGKNGSECSCKWHINSDKLVQITFVIGNVQ